MGGGGGGGGGVGETGQNRDGERDALVNDAMAKTEAAGLKQNHKNMAIYFLKQRNHKLRKKKKKKR